MNEEANRFTAYKIYTDDQSHAGHVRNLSRAEAIDESKFPLGPQFEANGRRFVWSYGINDGVKL